MKTIVVPLDFSANSETALIYASEFAKTVKAELILLNVYTITYPGSDLSPTIIQESNENAKNESIQQLKVFTNKINPDYKLAVRLETKEGIPLQAILETAETNKADLIIMGTKGSTAMANIIFGSTAAKVIEKAKCPVVAIPTGVNFKPIKKITYATDYNNSDIEYIKKLSELAAGFNAQLNILHVSYDKQSLEKGKDLMRIFMNKINEKVPYTNLSFQILNGNDIESALEEYLEDESTNMFVMATHQNTFFNKLFGKNVTKHMAYHTNIPLMAFHYKKIPLLKSI